MFVNNYVLLYDFSQLSSHLAAHQNKLAARNANARDIIGRGRVKSCIKFNLFIMLCRWDIISHLMELIWTFFTNLII